MAPPPPSWRWAESVAVEPKAALVSPVYEIWSTAVPVTADVLTKNCEATDVDDAMLFALSPVYLATTTYEPGRKFCADNCATPFASVCASPSDVRLVAVGPAEKVTVPPAGTGAPPASVTVAVKVVESPLENELGDALTVVVVAVLWGASTCSSSCPEIGLEVGLPRYEAVTM